MGKHRWVILVVAGLVLTLGGMAYGEEQAQAPLKLTLQQAIDLALQDSTTAKNAAISLEDARLTYEESKANLLAKASAISKLQSENTWQVAQRNHELAQVDIKLGVQQGYYNLLKAERTVVLNQKGYEQAQKNLETIQSKFKLEMMTDADVLNAEYQLGSAQADLDAAKGSLDMERMRFNQTIGQPLDAKIELVDQFGYEPVDVNLAAEIDFALKNRLEIKRAEDTVELRQQEVLINDNAYTPSLTKEKSKLALEQAKLDLESQRQSIIMEIKQAYQSMMQAAAKIELQQKNADRTKENLRVAEMRLEAGVISDLDLFDAQQSALQAETQLLQAIFDANVAKAKFFKAVAKSTNNVN